MRIKMLEANSTLYGEAKKLSLAEIVEKEHPKTNLSCLDCGVEVTWVKKHDRDKTKIDAYLRLRSGEHQDGCRYTVDRQLELIAAESSDNFIEAVKKNDYVLRLTMMSKAMAEVEQSMARVDLLPKNDSGVRYGKRGKLSAYLSTLRKILELKEMVESDAELADYLTLDFQGEKINWRNFYFKRDEQKRLYNYVNKRSDDNCHIVVYESEVTTIWNNYVNLANKTDRSSKKNDLTDSYKVALKVAEPVLENQTVKVNDRMVAFFIPTAFVKQNKNYLNHQVVGVIHSNNQMIKMEKPDE